MTRSHVCGVPGCPQLTPCPTHARPRNARWSSDRDGAAQNRFSAAVKRRAGGHCERCGASAPLSAHHVRPGYDPALGLALCDGCHAALDHNARGAA